MQAAYFDAFNPETQGSSGADRFPPLHVARFGHRRLGMLLRRRLIGIHLNHFLVHVLKTWKNH